MSGMRRRVAACLVALAALPAALADDRIATLRNGHIDEILPAPLMTPQSNQGRRAARNYPEQPPLIPHSIEGYQLDLNFNRCLDCHSRVATEESQAPMVSVTHFMDNEGQVRAAVTARRYFCTQCHVPQHDVRPLVDNTFVDIDRLIRSE